ncbi:MAG: serine/threonine-protein kinase [Sandaracinaceae bacterium]
MHEPSFGRYTLLERIDVGGMAEVFRAVQRGAAGFERVVAIKRILPNIATDADVVRMFIEEAKLAVQLAHPNIAHISDLGELDGTYFIAMEFIDGHSLKTLWNRLRELERPMPVDAACYILSQVAEALHYAHFAEDAQGEPLGIIHRDVSPQNVLISFGGEVKVIDFGLAKASSRASQTQDGIVKGKLAYLSPEQAHGKEIDRRSDLFSLGICTWEMLTGERAFRRDDDRETVLAIRRGDVAPISDYAALPPALERIVLRALAKDRDERYRTALALREDVVGFVREHRLQFDRRDMTSLMRGIFPERFADESARDAMPLTQLKSEKVDLDASHDDHSAELRTGELAAAPSEVDFDSATTTQMSLPQEADDTVPGLDIPEESD